MSTDFSEILFNNTINYRKETFLEEVIFLGNSDFTLNLWTKNFQHPKFSFKVAITFIRSTRDLLALIKLIIYIFFIFL